MDNGVLSKDVVVRGLRECRVLRRKMYIVKQRISFLKSSGVDLNSLGNMDLAYNRLVVDYNLAKYWWMPGKAFIKSDKKPFVKRLILGGK